MTTWIEALTEKWGEPTLSPSKPARDSDWVDFGWYKRRAWVWFVPVDGWRLNHNLSIDKHGGGYTTSLGSHRKGSNWGTFGTDDEPTDQQLRSWISIIWLDGEPL